MAHPWFRRLVCVATVTVGVCLVMRPAAARELSLDDRVAAQRAIEQVLWSHRIWPGDNPSPRPPLSAILPDAELHARVEDYLAKARALEVLWNRPITGVELQGEMDRMAARTRDAATLRELFDALGNDPFVIAETLARQTLADRLIRQLYASDSRYHGHLRARAEAALAACREVDCMSTLGDEYHETVLRLQSGTTRDDGAIVLDASEWSEQLASLARRFGNGPGELPVGTLGSLEETPDAFVVTAILSQRSGEITTASVQWPKEPFDRWWADQRGRVVSSVEVAADASFALPIVAGGGCPAEGWAAMFQDVPQARYRATAVWTGTEMIVWGGANHSLLALNTGGRYNPSTDAWTPTSTGENVPSPRMAHTAVWTGTKMIIWGGQYWNDGTILSTGGLYDPNTNRWLPTPTGPGAPEARDGHAAVWTGSEMIVWGGVTSSGMANSGGRYNPLTNAWTPTPTGAEAPFGGDDCTAVWTGTEMIVWASGAGARYRPSNNTWTTLEPNVPLPSSGHTAVWTGSEMILWGGTVLLSDVLNSGARYNPQTDTWSPTSTGANTPSARQHHTAIWTGTEMIVWGGYGSSPGATVNTGGRYNPTTDTWTPTSIGAQVAHERSNHAAVWTGSEMIVWGGKTGNSDLMTGGRYVPATDTWSFMRGTGPDRRFFHTAVWTGSEMIVWGGTSSWSSFPVMTGGRYQPATDSWLPTSMGAGVPAARQGHTAAWTGTKMIVWGGSVLTGSTNTGARYDPTTNSWAPTSTGIDVPSPRTLHTTVWTGTRMIVWGGLASLGVTNTGALYDPVSDTWSPISSGAGVASPRYGHAAVWTGSRMLVWGAAPEGGGQYDPSADAWLSMSSVNQPLSYRRYFSTVWTGAEMIVWGGTPNTGSGEALNSGGRFNPSANAWTPTSTAQPNTPTATFGHTAVWTGSEMIVWGGNYASSTLALGGRYNPLNDTWIPTALAPAGRTRHTAVWTGAEMIVWGGDAADGGDLYFLDGDVDSDGVCVGADNCPTVPNPSQADTDADYAGDACDNCPIVNNPFQTDADADAVGDACDACTDTDADGFGNPGFSANACPSDNCPTAANPSQADGDGDAIGDACDACPGDAVNDPDADGVCATVDNCPAAANPSQANADGDGMGDACDPCPNDAANDADADGVCGNLDNCPTLANPSQADVDVDLIGDACDSCSDSDHDGFGNPGFAGNTCPPDNCPTAANPSQLDGDGDGAGNACDTCPFDAEDDADHDGFCANADTCPLLYDPSQPDQDGDRDGDLCDNCPFDADPTQHDRDGDQVGDVCDLDDGFLFFRFYYSFSVDPYVEWQEETGTGPWHVYRGDLEVLRATGTYTQVPGSNPAADRQCGLNVPYYLDPWAPQPGKVAFFLATGTAGATGLGVDSAGVARPNAAPCP
ncbi:MAG TPA: thrombospondin type 3 repeat-containing protein [Candidatus Polarisedimenticolaceae bacterium]|nr:thrombospondin type 3 repeat-containing protein [Candidatus Polarisedimenticolaceae bacterium]